MNKEPSCTETLTDLRAIAAVQSARTGLGGAVYAVFFRLLLRMLDALAALFDAHRAGTLPQPVPRAPSQPTPAKSRPRAPTARIRRRSLTRGATIASVARVFAYAPHRAARPAADAPHHVAIVAIRCI